MLTRFSPSITELTEIPKVILTLAVAAQENGKDIRDDEMYLFVFPDIVKRYFPFCGFTRIYQDPD